MNRVSQDTLCVTTKAALHSVSRWILILLPAILCLAFIAPRAIADNPMATLTNKTGTVFYKTGNHQAEEVTTNKSLYAEDRIHTSNDSTAVISMLLEKTVVRLRERTTMEILPPQKKPGIWLNLVHGAMYLFSRGDSSEPSVTTIYGDAGFVGTEVVITVDSNQTVIAVINGTATLTNQTFHTNLTIHSRERIVATKDSPPIKTTLTATNLVQWWLFYPAVVDADELAFTDPERQALAASLQAYGEGDLLAALSSYPGYPSPAEPETDSGRIYLAALYLAQGEVDHTEDLLRTVPANSSLGQSLRWLIAAVQDHVDKSPEVHTSASEWLGLSYYWQARRDLPKALDAAHCSVAIDTNFAFGWERVGELEFSFGHTGKARVAVEKSLKLARRNAQAHALRGFLLSAENNFGEARKAFDEAIRLDANLGNGRLGRGLVRIHTGDTAGGRADLKMAAILEPNRSLLRSYLGKAFADAGEDKNAALEFERAEDWDSKDPTPWLYSALMKRDENRINEAVDDLEQSIRLNKNRAVYRSQLLLDEDQAVRSANLAAIYQDAGMTDVSVNEAGSAVTSDYANYSAHLFLANSYNALRDPNLINLRYESATFSEYLVANLLSPVGGSSLSSYVSQQEYSRLFAQQGPGFSSETIYSSRGDWLQQASIYGWNKNTGYAVDIYHRSQNGERPNNDLTQDGLSVELKQQLTPSDSVYVQAIFSDYDSGDLRQLYNWRSNSVSPADRNLRVNEFQEPNLFLGFHHEWSPALHTLFLAGRLEDNFKLSDRDVSIQGVVRDANGNVVNTLENIATNIGYEPGFGNQFDSLKYKSQFEAYSVELQQIAQLRHHTLIFGARYQDGNVQTEATEERAQGHILFLPMVNTNFVASQKHNPGLTRLSFYGYDQWQVLDPLWLVAGVAYDQLRYPKNVDLAPISTGEQTASQVSPKAGFIWTPEPGTTFRGAFTRSLGGLFYDGSVRLEPVQIAGFNQAYRSLIPESVEGAIPGSKFQTFDLALEQKFKSRTYFVAQLELLQSEAHRNVGVFNYDPNYLVKNYVGTSLIGQGLKYEERSLTLSLDQLVGREWSLGAHYKMSHADLKTRYPGLPEPLFPSTHESALLHTLDLHAIFNHPSGFFAEGQALWRGQSNFDNDSILAGDNFWQFNVFGGYRFPRRRAEATVGLLNVTGKNYHLNPLNLYDELPRDRTLQVSLKINF